MRKLFTALAMAAALAGPAMADETWKTEFGTIEWEKDYDGGAIFRVELEKGKFARFYIAGLTTDSVRGTFNGFYISTADEQMCAATLIGPDGTSSRTWGRLSLTFVDKGFPSDWTMLTGECLADPHEVLTGKANTGD
jgi:hypothetical protein